MAGNKKQRNIPLTDARKKLGSNQIELAEKLGINKTVYSTFESLYRFPPKKDQRKIIDYFEDQGISLDEKKVFSKILYDGYEKEDANKNPILFHTRSNLNLSVKEIAKEIGISSTYYSEIENCKEFPSEETQTKITDYLMMKGISLPEEDVFQRELYDSKFKKPEMTSLEEVDENKIDFEMNSIEEKVQEDDLTYRLQEFSKRILSERQREVLFSFYGICGFKKKNPAEMAEDYDLTKEMIRQIKERALRKLENKKDLVEKCLMRN